MPPALNRVEEASIQLLQASEMLRGDPFSAPARKKLIEGSRGKWQSYNCVWLYCHSYQFLCRLRSIAARRDHFVQRLSVCQSVRLSVCPSGIHIFLVDTHSYVLQATHAFLGMLPLCLVSWDECPGSLCNSPSVITFLPEKMGHSNCACVFLVTRPFMWYPNFFTL